MSSLSAALLTLVCLGSLMANASPASLSPGTLGKFNVSRVEPLIDGEPSIYMRPNQPQCEDEPKAYDPKLKAGDTYVLQIDSVTADGALSFKETHVVQSVSAQKISEKTEQTPVPASPIKSCYAVKGSAGSVNGTAAAGQFTLQSGETIDVHGVDRLSNHVTIACRKGAEAEVIMGQGTLEEIKLETEDLITDGMDRCSPHTTVFSYVNAVLDDGTLVSSSKTELLSATH